MWMELLTHLLALATLPSAEQGHKQTLAQHQELSKCINSVKLLHQTGTYRLGAGQKKNMPPGQLHT